MSAVFAWSLPLGERCPAGAEGETKLLAAADTKLSPSPASRDRLRSRAPLSRRGSQRAITTSSLVELLQSNQDTIEAKRSSLR